MSDICRLTNRLTHIEEPVKTVDGLPSGRSVCVDVDYRVDCVVAACVGFDDWLSAEPSFERASRSAGAPAGYEPGLLYRREMPYLLALMELLDARPRHCRRVRLAR